MTVSASWCPARRARGAVVFEGFRSLYAGPYLAYARVHLGPRRGPDAVERAFGALVRHWLRIVGSSNPAVAAWEQLVAHTGSRVRPLPLAARSPLEYDAIVLHHLLGYSVARTADITGHHPSKIGYLARTRPPTAARPARPAAKPLLDEPPPDGP
ncbi:hypothetical protein [Streptomyces buecherae]|uniref:hypothetical protein n=1 Tax=Streptomyces buecherae TaxID=2763006 RepID=UPI001C280E5E|nr:hypothetical protein [Streptomyces buecherae]